jgi:hypothetical protein
MGFNGDRTMAGIAVKSARVSDGLNTGAPRSREPKPGTTTTQAGKGKNIWESKEEKDARRQETKDA